TTQTTQERAENYLHKHVAAVGNNTPSSTISNGNLPILYQRDARSTTSSVFAIYALPNVTSEAGRWRYQQRLTAQLWKRWRQEYITTLNTRGKWHNTQHEPKDGDIVLIHESGTAWVKYSMGRIIEIHPSEDGISRSAKVKTAQGKVARSSRSLRLLEPASDE
ncbi:hypothetical protein T10_4597, partial [Trichinella papuae]